MLTKSYSRYAGVQGRHDPVVVWPQRGSFFPTAGFLGMMYYFVPEAGRTSVVSYRLSVVHFGRWIFTYMWAGPHHLHYTTAA